MHHRTNRYWSRTLHIQEKGLPMLLRAIVLFVFLALPAMAERKVALVIGNSAYTHAPALPNPQNDATAIAAKLGALGYEVQLEENLTGQTFRSALGLFSENALHSDLALVFYAGHGIELDGRNFLIPVDAQMTSESAARFETISLDQVISTVRGAATLGIVMLDACRDNPFAASMTRSNGTRSMSRGLAPVSVEGQGGMVVSFAAEAGNTAADGDSGHSPYTEAFLETLDQPGLEVGKMFRSLRAKVREKSNGRQVPVEHAQLPDHDVFITPDSGEIVPVATVTVQKPATPDADTLFFAAARENDGPKLQEFVKNYPDHPRVSDARHLIEVIEDNRMWESVASTQDAEGLRRYLLVFPKGKYSSQAAEALAVLQAFNAPSPIPVAPRVNPTFDCNKATTAVELAMCSSDALALQDHEMLTTYRRALAAGRISKSDQREWLQSREARCFGPTEAVIKCVYAYSAARIVALGG